jgi:hypothetical protein
VRFQWLSCDPVDQEDPLVRAIIRKCQYNFSSVEGAFYDTISRIPVIQEVERILSWIHEGSLLKITFRVGECFEPQTLILSIQETHCPGTKEHGKMKYVGSEFSHEDQSLTVTYKCPHLKCRLERVWLYHLPKLWEEAKEVLKNVRFLGIGST